MAASNLALAFVAVGTVALVFGFEWLLTFRGQIQMRPQSQMPYAASTTGRPSEDLEGNDSK